MKNELLYIESVKISHIRKPIPCLSLLSLSLSYKYKYIQIYSFIWMTIRSRKNWSGLLLVIKCAGAKLRRHTGEAQESSPLE